MSSAIQLSETDDDLKWQRIINDPRPRPALSALGDEIEKQFKTILRLAVTGKTSGPSLYHLLQVLGKERVMARIEMTLLEIN
jgi:glutamyl/glutaminyl-tRNA synthetase